MAANTAGQFYVTHCGRADSVVNTVGFSVRASSSADPGALRTAMEYPAYELPMDLWGTLPGRADAPRRLARVAAPGGGVLVVHSAYLEKDTMGRDRSYFSHALLLPAAAPADVLRSWAAPGWVTDYAPGEVKTLAAPAGVPAGADGVSDAALRRFLTAPDLGSGGGLGTAVWPDRLRADPAARRQLAEQFVHGVLLAAAADGTPRGRLYVHAEPGLVAMLLYAAARLLPPAAAADLTFTTYEPAHCRLREFKRALVVGTYFGHPAKSLDPELAADRGYGLDAAHPARSSVELRADAPAGVKNLVALAAAGKWKTVAAIHALCGDGAVSAARLAAAAVLSAGMDRLSAGAATAEDLVALQKDPRGRQAVADREADVWPRVRDLAPTDAAVRRAFRDWFRPPARADEVTAAAFAALVAGDRPGWDRGWEATADVLDRPAAAAALGRLLTFRAEDIPLLPPAARTALRAALATADAVDPQAVALLLAAASVAELDALLAEPGLPPWAVGYAAAAAWVTPPSAAADPLRRRAAAYATAADPDALGQFVRQAEQHFDARPELADELFAPAADGTAAAFDRLLNTGSQYASAGRWAWLADRLGLLRGEENLDFLTADRRLAKLLRATAADADGRPVWDWVADRLDDRLIEGDETARAVWGECDRADVLLKGDGRDATAAPGRFTRKREAGKVLLDALDNGAAEKYPASALTDAFGAFGKSAEDGLAAAFRGRCAAAAPAAAPKAYAAFARLFARLRPASETTYRPNERAYQEWVRLSDATAPEDRGVVQRYFFTAPRLAPANRGFRLDLVKDPNTEPEVAAAVRAERPARAEADPDLRQRGAYKKPLNRKSRKEKDGKRLMILLGAGGVGVILLMMVVVGLMFSGKGGKPPEKESAKGPEELARVEPPLAELVRGPDPVPVAAPAPPVARPPVIVVQPAPVPINTPRIQAPAPRPQAKTLDPEKTNLLLEEMATLLWLNNINRALAAVVSNVRLPAVTAPGGPAKVDPASRRN